MVKMRMNLALVPLAAALIASATGCASNPEPEIARAEAPPDWRSIVTEDDRVRLREWRTAWTRALAKARAAGLQLAIAREGRLLDPDVALPWRDPEPGLYRCRTIKIGARSQGLLDYISYRPFECRIRSENGLLSFTKLNGSQRPIGLIFPQAADRIVFLGTLQLGDETRALHYGHDRERDLAALVERVDERRWRLVFPYPHFESMIDIMELVPAADPSRP